MKSIVVCVLVLLAAVVKAENVVVLTAASFDAEIAKNSMTLVEFFAPWCGHCKALAPEYETAATQLKGLNHGVLASVDCTVEKDLCSRYEVRGFPTLKLFRSGAVTDYDQARSSDAIVKFMKKQSSPAVTVLANQPELAAWNPEEKVRIVGLFSSESDAAYTTYVQTANTLRNEYDFAAVIGAGAANVAHQYKVEVPSVFLILGFDDGQATFKGSLTDAAELAKFIVAESFPVVGNIGPENYGKYVERNLPLVWIFVDPNNQQHTALLKDVVTPVAKGHKAAMSFVWLDGVRWAEHAKQFGLSGNLVGIVIEDRLKRKNYLFPEGDAITTSSFGTFVKGFAEGTLAANVKSEPIPESNDEPVKVIVGKTFDSIVMDASKDVLVEFYAPWCGHCKSLAPKYDELGKLFAKASGVVIAKVDATANDTPADIQGFPTLIFYPAGDKTPVNYDGARTVEAMAAFVKANAKTKIPDDLAIPAAGEADAEDDHGHEDL